MRNCWLERFYERKRKVTPQYHGNVVATLEMENYIIELLCHRLARIRTMFSICNHHKSQSNISSTFHLAKESVVVMANDLLISYARFIELFSA